MTNRGLGNGTRVGGEFCFHLILTSPHFLGNPLNFNTVAIHFYIPANVCMFMCTFPEPPPFIFGKNLAKQFLKPYNRIKLMVED